MRKLTIKLEDTFSHETLESVTSLEQINDLYTTTGLNGFSQIVIILNDEMNKLIGDDFKLRIPNEVSKNQRV